MRKKIIKKFVKFIWVTFLTIIILIPLYLITVSINLFNLYGGMPGLKTLENPKTDIASDVYSEDHVLLGKYYTENRSPIDYDELSPFVVQALLSTEDERFYKHSGIDIVSLGRVAIYTLILQKKQGGGSTISQQLAKNLFATRAKENEGLLSDVPILGTIIFKTKEWLLAVKLERSYTKEEIIAMFLNTISFGNTTYGIKVASNSYFQKDPIELNVNEAALLIGIFNNPTAYNPVNNPENAQKRRNVVLRRMLKHDYITEKQYDSLKFKSLNLKYQLQTHNLGAAPYFRAYYKDYLYKWAKENNYDLEADGLKIYTTINSKLQFYAEQAVKEHMKYLQAAFNNHWRGRNPWTDENFQEKAGYIENLAKVSPAYKNLERKFGKENDSIRIMMNKPKKMRIFTWNGEKDTTMSSIDSIKYYRHFLQTGFMALNPHNGHIKAWVGGINYKYFKYDHVRQGKNQPGSTFKPFVYATAIDNGYSPCYQVADAPVTYPNPGGNPPLWSPKNSSTQYEGQTMTLRQAMGRSMNRITAFLMNKFGPENVVQMAHRIGIQTELPAMLSLSLGTIDLSLFELVGAYGTFANGGTYIEPIGILRIEDKNGNVLLQNVPKTREAISEETAYLMTYMLRGATEETGGTATGLSAELRSENEIGAKTGTTSNYADGWFMGVTKDLVAGAWVGGEDRSIRFRSFEYGQGARMAMPIWEKFMLKVYRDSSLGYTKGPFKTPAKGLTRELNCDEYRISSDTVADDQFYLDPSEIK